MFEFTLPYLTPNQNLYYSAILASLPSMLSEDPQIQVFAVLMAVVLGNQQDSIDGLTTLTDVDNCPSTFLPLLASIIGFPYNNSLTAESQIDLIKNYVQLYRIRGSSLAIKLAARFGNTTTFNLSDPVLNDIVVSSYSGTSATLNGTTYTGQGIYNLQIPSSVNATNNAIYLINPAGFLPVISRILETTVSVAPFDVNAYEVNNLYGYTLAYLTGDGYTLQQVDNQNLGINLESYLTATRPSGESVTVGGVTATSNGNPVIGEY